MRNKKNLQSQSAKTYLIDDVTAMRSRKLLSLRRGSTIKSAPSANANITVPNANDSKTVLNTLCFSKSVSQNCRKCFKPVKQPFRVRDTSSQNPHRTDS